MHRTRGWVKKNPEFYMGSKGIPMINVCISFKCENCGRKETWVDFDPNSQERGERTPTNVTIGKNKNSG